MASDVCSVAPHLCCLGILGPSLVGGDVTEQQALEQFLGFVATDIEKAWLPCSGTDGQATLILSDPQAGVGKGKEEEAEHGSMAVRMAV